MLSAELKKLCIFIFNNKITVGNKGHLLFVLVIEQYLGQIFEGYKKYDNLQL